VKVERRERMGVCVSNCTNKRLDKSKESSWKEESMSVQHSSMLLFVCSTSESFYFHYALLTELFLFRVFFLFLKYFYFKKIIFYISVLK